MIDLILIREVQKLYPLLKKAKIVMKNSVDK